MVPPLVPDGASGVQLRWVARMFVRLVPLAVFLPAVPPLWSDLGIFTVVDSAPLVTLAIGVYGLGRFVA